MAGDLIEQARALHRRALVIDAHAHSRTYLPSLLAAVFRRLNRHEYPDDLDFGELAAADVDMVVAEAVGDWWFTRWHLTAGGKAVERQLRSIEAEAASAGAVIIRRHDELIAAREQRLVAILLGVEGADFLGGNVDNLDRLYDRGVRVLVPVHLGHNQFGTSRSPWQHYIGDWVPVRRRTPGLTRMGHELVRRANELGVLLDVSHADRTTVLDICARSSAPVVATHAGARAVNSFERFLDDDEIVAIAATGGLVGLWPYFCRGEGVPTMAALADHAERIRSLVGPQHLCIGTDMNGVPGLTAGYSGEADLPFISATLLDRGFQETEVAGILGFNFARVLAEVEGAARVERVR
jgi:microsomal dipeptidase-like Zn-dependent dipeptidase